MRYTALLLALFVLFSCSKNIINIRKIYEVSELEKNLPEDDVKFIKVHMKNGYLVILRNWVIDNNSKQIQGKGFVYNTKRRLTSKKLTPLKLDFDECLLVESNAVDAHNTVSPFLMGFSLFISAITIPCIAEPKACFGSCPTYYLVSNDSLIIQAEGFSSSITRSLEAMDIDYLSDGDNLKGEIQLELKNEALETHYIRKSELLAVRKPEGNQMYHGSGKFYSTTHLTTPVSVNQGDEELLYLLSENDHQEYLAKSDSTDLTQKESIILEFDQFNGSNAGIIITKRQSFMTTYLFYQSLAYMGTKMGDLMAAYERASPLVRNAQKTIYEILGGVEVSIWDKNKWRKVGVINEQGPIVTDTHLLPVDIRGSFGKVKIEMTKGLWRIDQVALCKINGQEVPELIQANELLNAGISNPDLLADLNDPENMLVNNPGTTYRLVFDVPDEGNYAYFLRTQGYYTEWMRGEWLKEENPEMVFTLIKHPGEWLKIMAPKYKSVETEMESLFWNSKFANIE